MNTKTPPEEGVVFQPLQTKYNQSIIEINTLETFIGICVVLVGIGIAWCTLRTETKEIQHLLKDEIKPELKNLKERFVVVESKVISLWRDKVAPANSPRQLNKKGESILNESGIKKLLTTKKYYYLKK